MAFRAFVRDRARLLGISGWVRNRADGSVECLVGAGQDNLGEFESILATGPRWGRVDRIEKHLTDAIVNNPGFEIVGGK